MGWTSRLWAYGLVIHPEPMWVGQVILVGSLVFYAENAWDRQVDFGPMALSFI